MASRAKKHPGGRPAKFSEPRRPITVTLPLRVLRLLAAIDSDRAKAIVKLAETVGEQSGPPRDPLATVRIAPDKAIILVGHSAQLKRIPFLRLIEVAPGRHLISVESGTSIESMEVALHDLLETLPADHPSDRAILEGLLQIIRSSRRTRNTTKEEILFVTSSD